MGQKKTAVFLAAVVIFLAAGAARGTTYYIDYSSGSDTNNGTSKSTPWKHAPGMNGASGKVLAYETAHPNAQGTGPAGDSFIFKGGVTWPNSCFVWAWRNGGGTGWTVGVDAIYFGVDTTWYAGESWSRPVFDAEGLPVAPSTNGSGPFPTNTIFRAYKGAGGYFIIDNFEFKGLYHFTNERYTMLDVAAPVAEVKNCYLHGWGHGPVVNTGPCNDYGDGVLYDVCNRWTSGADSGKYIAGQLVAIGTPEGTPDIDIRVHHCYFDGSDSYPTPGNMAAATRGWMTHFYNNYVTHTQNIIVAHFCDYVWGNTFIENSRIPDVNSSMHHNVYQSYGGVWRKSHVYNNYIKDVAGGATFLWYPENTTKFYAFNNVICGDHNIPFALSSGKITSPSNTAGFYIWNNSVQSVPRWPWPTIAASTSGHPVSALLVKNNHLIAPSKNIIAGVNASVLDSAKNILQTNAEAISFNYTVESTYPLYPPTESSLTVGDGTDISSIFTELIDSDPSYPSTACLYDATLGVTIDTVNHTVSYPNRTPILRGQTWDIGAYEYMPELYLSSPHGGETWIKGTHHNITWSASGVTEPVKIELFKGGTFNRVIAENQAVTNGSYAWSIPAGQATGSDYTVKLTAGTHVSTSGNFTIAAPGAPMAQTLAAQSIATISAVLRGTVHPMGSGTSYHFEYGLTTAYGLTTPAATLNAEADATAVQAGLAGLTANTTYHFRLVASNSKGTAEGADRTFTTTSSGNGGGSSGEGGGGGGGGGCFISGTGGRTGGLIGFILVCAAFLLLMKGRRAMTMNVKSERHNMLLKHAKGRTAVRPYKKSIRGAMPVILTACFLLFLTAVPAWADTYWVSPNGTASWANARSETPLSGTACASLATANTNARAGDIVFLRGGTYLFSAQYAEAVDPSASGNPNAWITFQNALNESPQIQGAAGSGLRQWGIALNDRSYIIVKGMKFVDFSDMAIIRNSHHIEVTGCTFEDGGSFKSGGFQMVEKWSANGDIGYVSHIWVHGNVFLRLTAGGGEGGWGGISEGGDTIRIGYMHGTCYYGTCTEGLNRNITIEDNIVAHGGHTCFDSYGSRVVIRNNYFHNEPWYPENNAGLNPNNPSVYSNALYNGKYSHRNFHITDSFNRDGVFNLIENNRFGHAGVNPNNDGACNAAIASPKNIIRYNCMFNAMNDGMKFKYGGAAGGGNNNRAYNNTLYHNGYGYPYAETCTLSVCPWTLSGVRFWTRETFGNDVRNNIIYDNRSFYGGRRPGSDIVNAGPGNTIVNNWLTPNGDPKFVNPDLSQTANPMVPDLRLRPDSPVINQGTHLTIARNSGVDSLVLQVEDALNFQDGTGGADMTHGVTHFPDGIAIGTVSNTVRISSINYTTHTITLSSPMTWSNNAPIWLYKDSSDRIVLHGSAPDIGAHEYVPGIALSLPTGGELWVRGFSHAITWSSSGVTKPVRIELLKAGVLNQVIAENQAVANGSYAWLIPANQATGNDYTVKLTAGTYSDTSGAFTIAAPSAPVVTTNPATSVIQTSAVLRGSVHPMGLVTSYRFEYGLTTAYGSETADVNLAAGDETISVQEAIFGLNASTTYHFRLVASNSEGISEGTDRTLTTTTSSGGGNGGGSTDAGGGGGGCFIGNAQFHNITGGRWMAWGIWLFGLVLLLGFSLNRIWLRKMKKTIMRIGLMVAVLLSVCASTQAATYYIDFDNGSDIAAGISPQTAWRTLPGTMDATGTDWLRSNWGNGTFSYANKVSPGTVFRLKPGTVYDASDGGSFIVINSYFYQNGTAAAPIIIERYADWPGASGSVALDFSEITLGNWASVIKILGIEYIHITGTAGVNTPYDGIIIRNFLNSNFTYDGGFKIFGISDADKLDGFQLSYITTYNLEGFHVLLQWVNDFQISHCELNGNDVIGSVGLRIGGRPNAVTYQCTNGLIKDCISHDHGDPPGTQEGGTNVNIGFWIGDSRDITFEDCVAYDNKGDGYDMGMEGQEKLVDNIVFNRCISYNNADGFGVNLTDMPGNGRYYFLNCISRDNYTGFNVYHGPSAHIYNSVIEHNTRGVVLGDGRICNNRDTSVDIKNCIFSDNSRPEGIWTTRDQYLVPIDIVWISNYNFYDKGSNNGYILKVGSGWEDPTYYYTGVNNKKLDDIYTDMGQERYSYDSEIDKKNVGFLDQAIYDFRIQASSDCINAGVDLSISWPSGISTNDFAGNPRTAGSAWDIGAYEYVPGLSLNSPNGGEIWVQGFSHAITWSSSGVTEPVKIELIKSGATIVLAQNVAIADGSYTWSIPTNQAVGSDYSIKISAGSYADTSDTFIIAAPTVPIVQTLAAQSITKSSALVRGTINPMGLQTTYYFEYGPTTAYGSETTEATLAAGDQVTAVQASIPGLTASTTYHFRLVASNSAGITEGNDMTFTTSGGGGGGSSSGDSGGGGGGGCFIATAGHGSILLPVLPSLFLFFLGIGFVGWGWEKNHLTSAQMEAKPLTYQAAASTQLNQQRKNR